jgi:hypothetical protein
MPALYVCSPQPGDGKTTVAAALLSLLGSRAPSYVRIGDANPHRDAQLIKAAFGPAATAEQMSLAPGVPVGNAIAETELPPANGTVLVVAAYRGDRTVDEVRACAGANSVGVIVTQVPTAQRRVVEREIAPAFEAAGPRLLGVLPETRALRGHTVAEVAATLDGDVRTAPDRLDNVIESYMIGAMSHLGASGVPYFERMQNKAVVTGGDRIDIHNAALSTPCQALILTGGFEPDPVMVERSEAEGCPMVIVAGETPEVMDRIGQFLRTIRFRRPEQVAIAADLLRNHVDLGPIESALGLAAATA